MKKKKDKKAKGYFEEDYLGDTIKDDVNVYDVQMPKMWEEE